MYSFTWRVVRIILAVALGGFGLTALAMPASASEPSQYIGVPAYWSPNTTGGATQFDRLAQNSPTVGVTIINGPTSSAPIPFNQSTATAIQQMHDAGEKVLGYVDSGYLGQTGHTTTRVNPGSTAIADWQAQMEQDAAAWYSLYGSYGIDGIFFDETLSGCGTSNAYVDDYQTVTNYVRDNHSGAFIALNPGTSPAECYVSIADTLMIFENTYSVYSSWTPPSYVSNYPTSKFWNVVYDVPTQADMEGVISQSKTDDAGYVYVTDRTLDATHFPYDQLPNTDAYWNDELLTASGNGDTTPPGAAPNLTSTGSGCSSSSCSVSLSWDRATDDVAVVGYNVYRDGSLVQTVYGTSATITGGMSPNTAYTFSVKADDEAGQLGSADDVAVTTPVADTQPPTAPTDLSLTSQSGGSVSLSWEASTDNVGVDHYDILQNGAAQATSTTTNGTTTINGSTNGGSSYVYTTEAEDAAGNRSADSNELLVTIPPPTSGTIDLYSACMDSANAAFTAQFNESFDYHRVFLDTDNNTGTGYQLPYGNPGMDYLIENGALYHYTGSGSDWTWTQVNGATPLISDAGNYYQWAVPASDFGSAANQETVVFQAAGTSPETYSSPLTLSRTHGTSCYTGSSDTTPPTAPTNLSATNVTGTTTQLTWDASTDDTGVTGYDVYQDNALVTSVDGTTLSATVDGQTPASTFDYVVKARDGAGNASAASNQLTVTNPAPDTGGVTNYSVCMTSSAASYQATFNGTFAYAHVFINADNSTATGYELPYGYPAGNDFMIENNALYEYAGTGTDWTWSLVSAVSPLVSQSGGTYTWQIPISALGSSPASTQVIVFHAQGTDPDVYSQQVTVTQTSSC